jgi:hypothetical protein
MGDIAKTFMEFLGKIIEAGSNKKKIKEIEKAALKELKIYDDTLVNHRETIEILKKEMK